MSDEWNEGDDDSTYMDSSMKNLLKLAKKVKAERVPINSIKPAYTHDELPEGSAVTVGPILVDLTREILDGNHRYWEAKKAGQKWIEVKVIDQTSSIKRRLSA
jgi:hypothetical protein